MTEDAAASGRKKVLIVEDDKFLRELLVGKLEIEGLEALVAIDGVEGLKVIEEKKPDAVILDLMLPNVDGFQVLEKMKENPAQATIPVIVLSNLGHREDIERCMNMGAKDFMVKAHYTPNEIIDKVKSYL